jgi:predicted ArsR family transcriptional regulator
MTKLELLAFLARTANADADDVAQHFGVSRAAASMALLRLARQSLVQRFLDTEQSAFWYRLSRRGIARLAFLQDS